MIKQKSKILEKLSEISSLLLKCGGPGGTMGPCPTNQSTSKVYSKEEIKDAVTQYQKGAFMEINTKLRKGEPLDAKHQSIVDRLDQAGIPAKTDMETYRGLLAHQGEGQWIKNAKPGDTFHQKGFTSTGSKDIADDYSGYSFGNSARGISYLVKIEIPKGSKYIKGVIKDLKDEVTLPRNSVFEFKGLEGDIPVLILRGQKD